MKAVILIWFPWYRERENALTEKDKNLLKEISPSTIDRILKKYRRRFGKQGLSTTKPGSLIREYVPIKTEQWDEKRPGFVEADTLAHCGGSLSGTFIYSVNLVDIATGWTSQRAVWGKGEYNVLQAIKSIEEELPFKILGFDSDNGNEFLNWRLLKYFKKRKRPVSYTRSRPYKKNDNAHIEEKNWTIIRQYLDYKRFDKFGLVSLINDLYSKHLNFFINFFIPSVKLIDKQRVGSKIIKWHDKPKTPYHRLIESKFTSKETKLNLKKQFEKLNPYKLQKTIRMKISNILDLA
ncbi:MAG TPA: integrase [Ignavibacteria bacterium]